MRTEQSLHLSLHGLECSTSGEPTLCLLWRPVPMAQDEPGLLLDWSFREVRIDEQTDCHVRQK